MWTVTIIQVRFAEVPARSCTASKAGRTAAVLAIAPADEMLYRSRARLTYLQTPDFS